MDTIKLINNGWKHSFANTIFSLPVIYDGNQQKGNSSFSCPRCSLPPPPSLSFHQKVHQVSILDPNDGSYKRPMEWLMIFFTLIFGSLNHHHWTFFGIPIIIFNVFDILRAMVDDDSEVIKVWFGCHNVQKMPNKHFTT